jgi:hypothetical protein
VHPRVVLHRAPSQILGAAESVFVKHFQTEVAMQKHRLSEKLSGKKKISEATEYVEDEDSASRARAGPTPGPVSYGLAGPGAAPPAADIAGPSKRTNQLPSIAKLREAAETFQGLPSIYKRSKPGTSRSFAVFARLLWL